MERAEDRRGSGERRWGLDTDFPLKDCNGVLVISDRRRLCDRRLDNTSLEDRLLMFSGMAPIEKD